MSLTRFASVRVLISLIAGMPTVAAADEGSAGAEGGSRRVVVWISVRDDVDPAEDTCAEALTDLGLFLNRVRLGSADPSDADIGEVMAANGSAAVIWRGGDGRLHMAVARDGGPVERFGAAPGSPVEEAAFAREVLAARLENASGDLSILLATAPESREEAVRPPPFVVVRLPPRPPEPPRFDGPWIGAGYAYRCHFDSAFWGQHGIAVDAPAWRLDAGWIVRLELFAWLPARIGNEDERILEMSGYGARAGAAFLPVETASVDLEIFGAAGAEVLVAGAYVESGDAMRRDHVTPAAVAGMAFSWHTFQKVHVRLHADVTWITRPASFAVDGEGDFGESPWQPGGGLDIVMAMF